jgi:hypothetical protein
MKIHPLDGRKHRVDETNIRCLQLFCKRAYKTGVNVIGGVDVDGSCLAQDRNRWRALVNTVKADSHIACRAHAAPMSFPCHALPLKDYNVSFPFDLHSAAVSDSHLPCRAHAMLCHGLEKNGMVRAWHGRGMASVNQTRPHCVNQMGKTHSKPLAVRYAMCESTLMDLRVP